MVANVCFEPAPGEARQGAPAAGVVHASEYSSANSIRTIRYDPE
jgi:hypothetical protein